MIADLQLNPVSLDADAREPYAQRHPLQIAVCLRGLVTRQDFLSIGFGERQIVTQLLDVDSRRARVVFDLGSVEADNHALTSADQLFFHGTPSGIRTEFTTAGATPTTFGGRPAFEAPFPPVLYAMQRREYFRVETPVLDPYIACGTDVCGGAFRLEVKDLSLGGVALKAADQRFDAVESGTILRGVRLHLGSAGLLLLDLQIIAPRQHMMPNGDWRTVLGCKFVELPGADERILQRVVTQLETRRLALGPRG